METEEKKIPEGAEPQPDPVPTQRTPEQEPGPQQGPEGEPVADTQAAEPASGGAPEAGEGQAPVPEAADGTPAAKPERTFTQAEVNELIGRTRQEARQRAREEFAGEIRTKYGLDDDSQLDDLIGNGQRFDALNEEYGAQSASIRELTAENALLKSGVDESRFADVKAILAYQGLDVTPENIAEALTTHPEWKGGGIAPEAAAPNAADGTAGRPDPTPSVVTRIGGMPEAKGDEPEDERTRAMRLFGM